jgi:adenosylmethionine-8-amino-7-oxononanoate aminotransferase
MMSRSPVRRPHLKGSPAKRRARVRRRRRAPVVAEPALAVATAKESASLKTTLQDEPAVTAERAIRDTLAEAEEIEMLLGEEVDEEEPAGEEEAYFIKAPGQTRPRSGARPARGISGSAPEERAAGAVPKPARPAAVPPGPIAVTGGPRGAGPAGPSAEEEEEAAHLFPRNLNTAYPVAVRAEGIWIHDAAGRKYLDGCSGAVVCSIGHGVEEVAAVMTGQARRLAFAHSSQFITREAMGLASRVAALAPGDMKKTGRVYLVSGGSEAVETAIKLARQYHVETGRPGKSKIIARWQSYHGSTMGALAVTGNVARRALYQPMFAPMPHIPPCYCYRCPYGLEFPSCGTACVEDLETAIRQEGPDTVAAFIAEPVVGATLGAVPAVEGYWQRAREICTKHDVLLIADEVMTGVGRTGRNFAVDHFRVVPDLIVTGKGLSGGYAPLGAVIARGFVADALKAGRGYFEHGFTYSANPLSAAVGSAVLDYLAKNNLIARASRMGKVLGGKLQALKRHPLVGDVRGLGMMWGLEIVKDRKTREPFPPSLKASRRLYDLCLLEGLLIYPGSGTREGQDGDHFIIAPPFTITGAEIDDLVARLDRGLKALAAALR